MAVNNCSPGNEALAVSMLKPRHSSTVRDTLEVYPYEIDKLKRPHRFIPISTKVFVHKKTLLIHLTKYEKLKSHCANKNRPLLLDMIKTRLGIF